MRPTDRRLLPSLCTALLLAATPAHALDILLTNDDGFETANLRALQQRLVAAGHTVLVSAPTQNNSGTGGAMRFLRPITPLAQDTRYGAVKAGAPGVGVDPADADVHYVDGTPVMALLYGLDVLTVRRWGRAPDLVISGPNEGANLGIINNSSGTFNNALYAINRGVPAIAVSYGGTGSRSYAGLNEDAVEYRVADLVVTVIDRLVAAAGDNAPLLPPGVGLNVNIPELEGEALPPLRYSRIGRAGEYQPVFYEKLSDSPIAVGYGAGVDLPGISLVLPGMAPPAGVSLPDDADARSEGNVFHTGAVSVSIIEGAAQARRSNEDWVRVRLDDLLVQP